MALHNLRARECEAGGEHIPVKSGLHLLTAATGLTAPIHKKRGFVSNANQRLMRPVRTLTMPQACCIAARAGGALDTRTWKMRAYVRRQAGTGGFREIGYSKASIGVAVVPLALWLCGRN
jgi:hypothetical protein